MAESYPFVERDPKLGMASLAPFLPITLLGAKSVSALGLLGTGATVNVLPYAMGEQLGAMWDQQTTPMTLSGNLAACEARALIVPVLIGKFAAVRLAFAGAKTDGVPLLLGQVNCFMEFDVCFYRSRLRFDVRPKQAPEGPP
jgi:hypothetical protein